jgi:hypothetical protein
MKRIAIVGSVSAKRTDYRVPVKNHEEATMVARTLGTELAQRGLGLIVYSVDPNFVEADLVAAYVATGKAKPRSIHLVYPASDPKAAEFPALKTHPDLFDVSPDRSPDWEGAYFRSLKKADGVLLMGGGYSTLITGVIARAFLIPMVSLSYFGGSAEKIWGSLVTGQDLQSEDVINLMALAPNAASVHQLVASYADQTATREKLSQSSVGAGKVIAAIFALLGWVAALPIGFLVLPDAIPKGAPIHCPAFLFLLFLAPMVAGFSGSTVRYILPSKERPSWVNTLAGAVAGATTGILYIASQLVGGSTLYNFVWLLFAVVFGFIGGFTYDRVFAKLQATDVTRTEALTG